MKSSLTKINGLFFTIAAILACSYAALFIVSIITVQQFIEEQTAKDLEYSLKFAKNQFNGRQELALEALKLSAATQSVQKLFTSADKEELANSVVQWKKSLDFLEILTVLDARHTVIARINGQRNSPIFLQPELLNSFFDRKQPIMTTELVQHDEYCREVKTDVCQTVPKNGEVMVQITFLPVIDTAGNVIGAIIAGDEINKDPYLPFLQQKVLEKTIEMLVTQKGELIASTMTDSSGLRSSLGPRVFQSLQNGYAYEGTTVLSGRRFEMHAEPIRNYKGEFIGSIAVALGVDRFAGLANDHYQYLIICGTVSSAVVFLLAYFITAQLTTPVRRFSDAVKAVEAGDYAITIPESGIFTIKSLAENFNRMTGALRERSIGLANQSSALRTRNEELEKRALERDTRLEAEISVYRSIVKSLVDGLIVADEQQMIIAINPSAEKMLGVQSSAVVGKPLAQLFALQGLPELEGLMNSRTADDNSANEAVMMLNYDRTKLRFALTVLGEGKESGRGFLLGVRDVTTDGEVDRLKSGFIAKVSHELKTPLTSMKGSLQFILKKGKWLTGVEREMLTVCLRNTERLIGLVAGIIEISRIESGQIAFSRRPIQIGEVVLYALEELKGAALIKNISIVNDVPMDLPKVFGDYERLTQVLSNLLSNAVKFSPQNSVINLSAALEKSFLTIFVADDGQVIPEAQRFTLFSRFQQMGRPEEGEFCGSGLGLAICKEIIDRHGGSIFHEPGVGKGNVFGFKVPLHGDDDGNKQDTYCG